MGKSPAKRLKIHFTAMQHIESQLEKQCRAYARAHGCVCWKNEKNGNKGIPDDSFLTSQGKFFFVEFKKSKNAKVSPEQIIWQQRFPNLIYLIHDFDTFVKLIDQMNENDK